MAMEAAHRAEVGQRIKELRGPLPQPELARRVGVSLRAVQKWESGDSAPQWENLVTLAKFFGVTQDFLLYGERGQRERAATQLDRIEEELARQGRLLEDLLSRIPGEGLAAAFEEAARRRGDQRERSGEDPKRKPRKRSGS